VHYRVDAVDVADFDFSLPDELIAQDPPPARGESRLLVMHRDTGTLEHARFAELVHHLRPGDLLVLNNTRVFPARLIGRREPSGGAVECLLLRQLRTEQLPTPDANSNSDAPNEAVRNARTRNSGLSDQRVGGRNSEFEEFKSGVLEGGSFGVGSSVWEALVHPGQKLKPGARMRFEACGVGLQGEILGRHFHGRRTVRLRRDDGGDVIDAIERIGHIPLPPYIRRADRPDDRERYQTVYARSTGSIAAPTAGLHFTPALFAALAANGIRSTEVTLHIGYGTFKPVRTSRVEEHIVDPEPFGVGPDAADALNSARLEGRRVIAVGTTTVRVLESLPVDAAGKVQPTSGNASLFIRPGHQFRLVDGMITNFHLPRSSLFILVCAFTGRERALNAYREAIERQYRFYSYGDAMVIL
jgi:S-adenosylmethionine:tRNA ribosyltransferase-isomerase